MMQHRTATGTLVPVDAKHITQEVGHETTEQIRTVYGHLTRDRVSATELDYGDLRLGADERAERARKEHGANVSAGLQAKKRRDGAVRRTASSSDTKNEPGAEAVPPMPTTVSERAACDRVIAAQRIRAYQKKHGLTVDALAARLGTAAGEIRTILRGDLSRIPPARVASYAQQLRTRRVADSEPARAECQIAKGF